MADEHETRVRAVEQRDVAFFEAKLQHYLREQIAGTRRQNLDIPGARLSIRQGRVRTEVTDEAELVSWLEDHYPAAVTYREPCAAKTDVKERFGGKVADEPGDYPAVDAETGEVLPGVSFVRDVPRFTIKLHESADE